MLQHDGIAVAGPHAVAGVSAVLAPSVAGPLAVAGPHAVAGVSAVLASTVAGVLAS